MLKYFWSCYKNKKIVEIFPDFFWLNIVIAYLKFRQEKLQTQSFKEWCCCCSYTTTTQNDIDKKNYVFSIFNEIDYVKPTNIEPIYGKCLSQDSSQDIIFYGTKEDWKCIRKKIGKLLVFAKTDSKVIIWYHKLLKIVNSIISIFDQTVKLDKTGQSQKTCSDFIQERPFKILTLSQSDELYVLGWAKYLTQVDTTIDIPLSHVILPERYSTSNISLTITCNKGIRIEKHEPIKLTEDVNSVELDDIIII